MRRFVLLGVVAWLCLLAVLSGESVADERAGWTHVKAVPAWVAAPPYRKGYLRFVDGAQSNRLDLAYPDTDTPTARRNVHLWLLPRLVPVLGDKARAASELAAVSAKSVKQVYLFRAAPRSRRATVGGAVYTVFVLWELPVEALLVAVPADKRDAVLAALSARGAGSGVAWKTVPAAPAWAPDPPAVEGRVRVATKNASGTWPVTRALADLRGGASLRTEVQGRLRPVLGNTRAFEIGVVIAGRGRLLERVRIDASDVGWQLWEVDFDDMLTCVPATHAGLARKALAGPRPPQPWSWEDAVEEAPAWAANPPAWPEHTPIVQKRSADSAAVARKLSAKGGAQDVADVLAARLEPSLGPVAARRAAEAGARRRQLVRKALREVPGSATVWTLWEVPFVEILGALPEAQRPAAKAALALR